MGEEDGKSEAKENKDTTHQEDRHKPKDGRKNRQDEPGKDEKNDEHTQRAKHKTARTTRKRDATNRTERRGKEEGWRKAILAP